MPLNDLIFKRSCQVLSGPKQHAKIFANDLDKPNFYIYICCTMSIRPNNCTTSADPRDENLKETAARPRAQDRKEHGPSTLEPDDRKLTATGQGRLAVAQRSHTGEAGARKAPVLSAGQRQQLFITVTLPVDVWEGIIDGYRNGQDPLCQDQLDWCLAATGLAATGLAADSLRQGGRHGY